MSKKVTLYLDDRAIESLNRLFGKNKSFGVSWLLIQFEKHKDFNKIQEKKKNDQVYR